MLRPVVLAITALAASAHPAHIMASPQAHDGLKVWITRGGAYCIRELPIPGKLRCQSAAAWAKEGVTFTRAHPAPGPGVTATPLAE